MPKCIIDGREAQFTAGQNLIDVASSIGIEIPRFCYHPALSVVAQCRMCVVEIEKMPKLQTACSTPAAEGMIVNTKSPRVLRAQKAAMEFLLINHPLDCAICDKSAECDLQELSFKYGDANSRYTEERRTYLDLDMGPIIKKNMNRCIHCTRCIRFGSEVAGVREMVALSRGNNTEIATIDGRALETGYAGNYADICPTGSLTLKDFRFKKRVWMLKKTSTVCEGCSKGCNMEAHHDGDVIYRCVPRENKEINKYWLCDEGRFNFHYVHDHERITEPCIKVDGELKMTDWNGALGSALKSVRAAVDGKQAALLVGSDLTMEEGKIALEFASKHLPGAGVFHFGTPGVSGSSDDGPADNFLKRKSKTANLHGVEKLGIRGFSGLKPGISCVFVIRGGRAMVPDLDGVSVVGVGVFNKKEARKFSSVLPATSFVEKEGTVVNCDGREQQLTKAIGAPGKCKQLREIVNLWADSGASG